MKMLSLLISVIFLSSMCHGLCGMEQEQTNKARGDVKQGHGFVFIQPHHINALCKQYGLNMPLVWDDATENLSKSPSPEEFNAAMKPVQQEIEKVFAKIWKKSKEVPWDATKPLSDNLNILGFQTGSDQKFDMTTLTKDIFTTNQEFVVVGASTEKVVAGICSMILKYCDPGSLAKRQKAPKTKENGEQQIGDLHLLSEPYMPLVLQTLDDGNIKITGVPCARQDELFADDEVTDEEVSTLNRYTKIFFDVLLLTSNVIKEVDKVRTFPQQPGACLEVKGAASKDEVSQSLDTLGLKQGAKLSDVKKAFKELTFKYHPDKSTAHSEKMIEINKAYEILKQNIRP